MRGALMIVFGIPLCAYLFGMLYESKIIQCDLLGNLNKCPYTQEQIHSILVNDKKHQNFSSSGSGVCEYSWQIAKDGSKCGKRAKNK